MNNKTIEENETKGQIRIGLFDQDIKEYHATNAISSTNLREFMNSKKKFMSRMNGQMVREETDAFRIGSAVHCSILEPKKFTELFQVLPEINRRTKEGRLEYEQLNIGASANGVTLLTADQMELVKGICKSVDEDSISKDLLLNTQREMSARVKLSNDLLVQCRPDALKPGFLIDIKTCLNVSKFPYEMKSYGYHLQAAFYYFILSSIMPEEHADSSFYFIAVEKSVPYEVKTYGIDNMTLRFLVDEHIKPNLIKIKKFMDDPSVEENEIEWLNIL